jgi:hypothetical protein
VYSGCEDGVSLSRPRNGRPRQRRQQDTASKDMAVQARVWQLKPKIGITLCTTPTRFSKKGRAMAGAAAEQLDDAEFEGVGPVRA